MFLRTGAVTGKMTKRILIIDDEISIRETLAGILEDEGFAATGVSSAEEGLELSRDHEH